MELMRSSGFQSHHGLILTIDYCSMVLILQELFQSHHGLILTVEELENELDELKGFQSHHGLILTTQRHLKVSLILSFQSHHGLILTFFPIENITHNFFIISIPPWSYFNLNACSSRHPPAPQLISIPPWSYFNQVNNGKSC